MRPFFVLVLIFNLGCGNNESENKSVEQASSPGKPIAELPMWLNDFYPPRIDTTSSNPSTQTILRFRQLNDSLSYCLTSIHNGVCEAEFLTTFIGMRKQDELCVKRYCDQDGSDPSYETKNYVVINDTIFQVKELVERVDSSFIDKDGWIKDGFDYFSINEKKQDSTEYRISIDNNGKLRRI